MYRRPRRPCAGGGPTKDCIPASDGAVEGRRRKPESAYFYSRAFRCATRCRGGCGGYCQRLRTDMESVPTIKWETRHCSPGRQADLPSNPKTQQGGRIDRPGQRLAAAQPLAALLPYGCGVPLAGKAEGAEREAGANAVLHPSYPLHHLCGSRVFQAPGEGAGTTGPPIPAGPIRSPPVLTNRRDACSSKRVFFWTVHGPFSFRQDEKKMGGAVPREPPSLRKKNYSPPLRGI